MQYPKIMQPTHARWEQILPESPASHVQHDRMTEKHSFMSREAVQINGFIGPRETSIFTQIPPVYTRKFMVTDTFYETAPTSTLGYPGPDEALIDIDAAGLTHVSEEIVAELPTECHDAFIKARAQEDTWKGRWNTEAVDNARGELKITYNV